MRNNLKIIPITVLGAGIALTAVLSFVIHRREQLSMVAVETMKVDEARVFWDYYSKMVTSLPTDGVPNSSWFQDDAQSIYKTEGGHTRMMTPTNKSRISVKARRETTKTAGLAKKEAAYVLHNGCHVNAMFFDRKKPFGSKTGKIIARNQTGSYSDQMSVKIRKFTSVKPATTRIELNAINSDILLVANSYENVGSQLRQVSPEQLV